MAAISLFWNTNKAHVTSCENALYHGFGLGHYILYMYKVLNEAQTIKIHLEDQKNTFITDR